MDGEEIKGEEEDRKRGEKGRGRDEGRRRRREGFTSFSKKKHNKTDEWKSVGELL